ncbi:MAG: PAS domain S-box protein, partial [Bacteroidia bacterium]
MKFLTNRTILLGFIINILVILLVLVVSVQRIKIQTEIQKEEENSALVINSLQHTHSEINEFQNNANEYIISGNLNYFNAANKHIFNTQENLDELKGLLKNSPGQATNLNNLLTAAGKKITYHSQLMENARYKDVRVAREELPEVENAHLNDLIDGYVKVMMDDEKSGLLKKKEEKEAKATKLKIIFLVFSILALLLLTLVFFIFRQYMKMRMANEKQLRNDERLLKSITDNTSNPIFIKEVNGQYLLTNRQFEYLFRGKTDYVKGKTDYQIFPKEIADNRRDNDLEIFKTGKEIKFEEVLPHDDGKLHTYITVKFPIKDQEGRIYAIGGISTDITENKSTDVIIRENEETVRNILEAAPDAVIVIDEDSKIVKWNHKAEELFKWKAEEVLGNPLYEFIMPPAYKDQHLKGLRNFIKTGQGPLMNHTVEIKGLNKDKAEIDIEMTISASRPKNKYIFIAFIREITQRKQLEKEKVEARNFLDSVIDNIPDMIFVKEAKDLKFVRLNKSGEKLLGFKTEEVLGKNDYDFFPKEQADFFTSKDREVLENKTAIDIPEEIIDTKDGKKWLHTKKITIRDAKGFPAYLLGISEDITERTKLENEKKAAYELLRETEEKTTLILENIGDAVIATDDKLNIAYMNPVAERLTGWKEEEARGKHVDEVFKIINEFTRQKVDNPVSKAINEKRVVDLARNTILIKQDNSEIFISDTGSPILDKNGNVTGSVLIFSDISEQRISEKQVEDSNKKFTQVFNFSPVPLSISSINDGRLLYVNDAFCKILGFSREEVIGKTSIELGILDPKERANILEYSQKKGGIVQDIEARIKKKDGTFVDVLFSVEILEIDHVQCAVIAFVNITERKNSEQRIAMVLENIGEGVIVADNKERVLLSNHIADEILGIDGQHYSSDWTDRYDIYYPDGSVFPAQNLPIEKALKGEVSDEVEIIVEDRETKDKKLLKVSGQPIINQDNKIVAA